MLVIFFALLLLANLSSAWQFDKLCGDGVYQFKFPKTGKVKNMTPNITHYDIDPFSNFAIRKPGTLIRKSSTLRFCTGGELPQENLYYAERALMAWCEMYNPQERSIVVSVFGNTTFYLRTSKYSRLLGVKTPGYCSAKIVREATGYLDDHCGVFSPAILSSGSYGRLFGRSLKMSLSFVKV